MNNVICIVGPTASGKTALAVQIAQELDGEVVSCDSMQVYRRMNIGTAKPTEAEMGGIVHHMIDVADPEEDYSVSRYCRSAVPIVEDILSRGRTAVIAGGTGLYVDSLIQGRVFAPLPDDGTRERLERRAEAEGNEALLRELARVDPETAARLHPSDRKRIIRALEVYCQTGQTMTEHNRRNQSIPPKFTPVWLGLDFPERAQLYARIDRRVDVMLERGLLDEVRSLLDSGVSAGCTAMQAIGYKEFVEALNGKCTVSEAADRVRQSSRRYAKRQLTWFRRNKEIHWLMRAPDLGPAEIMAAARQILQENDS